MRGISITMLEIELGLGNGTIGKWDKSAPSSDKLARVADFFDVSVDYIMGRKDRVQPTDDDIQVALFGGDGEVTPEMWDEARRYAMYIKEKHKK